MNVFGILTLIAVGALVVALAVVLVTVLVVLRRIRFTLSTVNVGVQAIARRVEPVGPLVREINSEIASANMTLTEVVARARV